MIEASNITQKQIELLFVKEYPKLVGFANKFVPMDVAEDIVQDVFLKMLKKVNDINITATLESYVYKAIKNKYQDYLKTQNVHLSYIDRTVASLKNEELDYYNPQNKRSLLLDDNEMAVFEAIERLPEKCKAIIKSKYIDGKRTNEISKEFGISSRTVETHIYKALKQLKVSFKDISLFFMSLLAYVIRF